MPLQGSVAVAVGEASVTAMTLLSRTAVLIPALNEEEALPSVLAALPLRHLHAVVVADNGSTDANARIAREAGATVVREEERVYGVACLAGLALEDLRSPGDVAAGGHEDVYTLAWERLRRV